MTKAPLSKDIEVTLPVCSSTVERPHCAGGCGFESRQMINGVDFRGRGRRTTVWNVLVKSLNAPRDFRRVV
jgi:hypothetical protein